MPDSGQILENLALRQSTPQDLGAMTALYRAVFPDEDLLGLVSGLMTEPSGVLSLVGLIGDELVANVIFTGCKVACCPDTVALLGPLAVAPDWQRSGIGSAIVREGVRRLQEAGLVKVFALGDPAYYGRLGFVPETRVEPPYALPEEWRGAWQSLSLQATGRKLEGTLDVPEPWRQPALWTS